MLRRSCVRLFSRGAQRPRAALSSSSSSLAATATVRAISTPPTAAHSPSASADGAGTQQAPKVPKAPKAPKGKHKHKERCDGGAAEAAEAVAARPLSQMPLAYHSFDGVMPLKTFHAEFGHLAAGARAEGRAVRVAGRLIGLRDMGRIVFGTLRGDHGATVQVVLQAADAAGREALRQATRLLRVGDIVGADGTPGRTQRGELSVYADALPILVPYRCTDQSVCPDLKGFLPVADADIKYRYRFVDMMTNPTTTEHFRRRHVMLRALRAYLDARDFTEVETPVLQAVASGANARPFVTHHNANDAELFLRVAPELHLKQCVAGGMERVYEIGRVFRNEDADRSHNPEFTSCELYAAYHTYRDLMPLTEEILRHMALAVNGHTRVTVRSVATGADTVIDLAQPFRRVSAYDEIQRLAGVELPAPAELTTPKGLAYLSAIMLQHRVPLPAVRTGAKLFDKLIDHFITDRAEAPVFVMDHPLCMSPLAKEHAARPGLSERFELFINGCEYCNAYSELNDPAEQHRRFQQQLADRSRGDDETMALDETFLKALQVGLPPTAGWGLGVDRVVALLNGAASIRDEIIFPLLRRDSGSHDSKRRRRTASFFGFSRETTLFCLSALEEEMGRTAAPAASRESLRQLRAFIEGMERRSSEQNDAALRRLAAECEVGGLRREVTMAVLRLVCGRFKS